MTESRGLIEVYACSYGPHWILPLINSVYYLAFYSGWIFQLNSRPMVLMFAYRLVFLDQWRSQGEVGVKPHWLSNQKRFNARIALYYCFDT